MGINSPGFLFAGLQVDSLVLFYLRPWLLRVVLAGCGLICPCPWRLGVV